MLVAWRPYSKERGSRNRGANFRSFTWPNIHKVVEKVECVSKVAPPVSAPHMERSPPHGELHGRENRLNRGLPMRKVRLYCIFISIHNISNVITLLQEMWNHVWRAGHWDESCPRERCCKHSWDWRKMLRVGKWKKNTTSTFRPNSKLGPKGIFKCSELPWTKNRLEVYKNVYPAPCRSNDYAVDRTGAPHISGQGSRPTPRRRPDEETALKSLLVRSSS